MKAASQVPLCGFWPRPHSLRGRFTVANVAFLAVGLVLAAAASIAATYMVLIGEIDDSLKSAQSSIARASLDAKGLNQLCTLADLLGSRDGSAVAKAFQQDLLIVLDRDGRPSAMCDNGATPIDHEQRELAAALPDPEKLAGGGTATVRSGDRKYRVVAVRLPDGTIVVKGMRLTGVEHAVSRLLIVEGCVGVVLLALLAAGSMSAARRRLSPLEDMVHTASAISEGDLSRRVPVPTARHGSEEVEQLSGALNAMLQQIETALTGSERATAQLRQFLADASHELRTPLASVRGYLQLYEKGMLDPDEQERALGRVSAEALRMSRLVDELLVLARLDDAPALRFGPVDLTCVVREAAADLAAQQPGRPMTLRLTDPGGGQPPAVLGDEAGLRQVVGNLLGNVRVHTPKDAPVTVEVAKDGAAGIRLTVSDGGPGLATADAARVFDRFFRAAPDRGRDSGGSGLGMSIVHALVTAHHGTVRVDTAPGAGLTVRVTLPAAVPAVPGVPRAAGPTAPTGSPRAGAPSRTPLPPPDGDARRGAVGGRPYAADMAMVTFVDETTSGRRRGSWGLEIAEERLTVGELIRRRVFQEVAEYHAAQPRFFQGLVQPLDAEQELNGYRLRTARRIEPEQQYALARTAFGRNGFLVLVGDRQVEEWDEEVDLPLGTEVVFLKLVPLVGG